MKRYEVTYKVTLHIEADNPDEAAHNVRNLIAADNQNLVGWPTLVDVKEAEATFGP